MSAFAAWNIAASSMSARRLQMDIISNNLANAQTTRTEKGGPFRRQVAVFQPITDQPTQKSSIFPHVLDPQVGQGVRVVRVDEDKSDGRWRYDPSHPDAQSAGDRQGYVHLPNVDVVREMTDMISASRAYEASATVVQNAKRMFSSALAIGARA